MKDLLPTTEQLVQTMQDADIGKALRTQTCRIGIGVCVPGTTPDECLFGIMIGDHAGPIYRLPATALVDALNSTLWWDVVTAEDRRAEVSALRELHAWAKQHEDRETYLSTVMTPGTPGHNGCLIRAQVNKEYRERIEALLP